jgi:hypothetical protein
MGNQQTKSEVKKINPTELQTYIMIVQAKLTQNRNKKVENIKKKRKEISSCLQDNNLDIAKAKMESLLREEDYITVFDILGPLCEILKEKVTYMLLADKCPDDLRAAMDTVIYSSTRLEIDEMHKIREMVRFRYGELYISKANSNSDQLVNVNVVEKLKVKPATDQYLVARLKQLCREEDITFDFPQEIVPMVSSFEQFHNFDNQFSGHPGFPGMPGTDFNNQFMNYPNPNFTPGMQPNMQNMHNFENTPQNFNPQYPQQMPMQNINMYNMQTMPNIPQFGSDQHYPHINKEFNNPNPNTMKMNPGQGQINAPLSQDHSGFNYKDPGFNYNPFPEGSQGMGMGGNMQNMQHMPNFNAYQTQMGLSGNSNTGLGFPENNQMKFQVNNDVSGGSSLVKRTQEIQQKPQVSENSIPQSGPGGMNYNFNNFNPNLFSAPGDDSGKFPSKSVILGKPNEPQNIQSNSNNFPQDENLNFPGMRNTAPNFPKPLEKIDEIGSSYNANSPTISKNFSNTTPNVSESNFNILRTNQPPQGNQSENFAQNQSNISQPNPYQDDFNPHGSNYKEKRGSSVSNKLYSNEEFSTPKPLDESELFPSSRKNEISNMSFPQPNSSKMNQPNSQGNNIVGSVDEMFPRASNDDEFPRPKK